MKTAKEIRAISDSFKANIETFAEAIEEAAREGLYSIDIEEPALTKQEILAFNLLGFEAHSNIVSWAPARTDER